MAGAPKSAHQTRARGPNCTNQGLEWSGALSSSNWLNNKFTSILYLRFQLLMGNCENRSRSGRKKQQKHQQEKQPAAEKNGLFAFATCGCHEEFKIFSIIYRRCEQRIALCMIQSALQVRWIPITEMSDLPLIQHHLKAQTDLKGSFNRTPELY